MSANNAQVMREVKSQDDYINLQEYLDTLQRWPDIRSMKFNTSKCTVMRMGHSERKPHYDYNLAQNKLHESVCEKNL